MPPSSDRTPSSSTAAGGTAAAANTEPTATTANSPATAGGAAAAAPTAAAKSPSVVPQGASAATGRSQATTNEEELRCQLRSLAQSLKRREPLKPTYKHLLTDGIVTTRKPVLPKDKFYRRIGSRLRTTVEAFCAEMEGKDPFDRIAQRPPILTTDGGNNNNNNNNNNEQQQKMRAALTLREWKEHEQTPLLEATLAVLMSVRRPLRPGGGPVVDELTRRRYWDGVAVGLQSHQKPRKLILTTPKAPPALSEMDQKRQEARKREEARHQQQQQQLLEEENRKRRRGVDGSNNNNNNANNNNNNNNKTSGTSKSPPPPPPETPQQALHKFYHPIFKLLWDMEFPYLGHTNPFRMVIDRENCAAVGAPDYFEVVQQPMNLTYIQRKVDAMAYHSLSDFFADVDLMLQNAVLYNSDPNNLYRKAAEDMQKRYKRAAKKTVQTIEKKYGSK
ncbi:hypothetical protein ACA910_011828 [Epithemia clementina (nom. ined.)]